MEKRERSGGFIGNRSLTCTETLQPAQWVCPSSSLIKYIRFFRKAAVLLLPSHFFPVTTRVTLQVTMRVIASLSLSVALVQLLDLTLAMPTLQSSTSSLVSRSPMCFNAPGTKAGT